MEKKDLEAAIFGSRTGKGESSGSVEVVPKNNPPEALPYRDKFFENETRETIIGRIAQEIYDRRISDVETAAEKEYEGLPLYYDEIDKLLRKSGIKKETEKAIKFMKEWDYDRAVDIYNRKYGKEIPSATEVVTPIAAVEVAQVIEKPDKKIFTPEQSKELMGLIAVASNRFKEWLKEPKQWKSEFGDEEAREKIIFDQIKEVIGNVINKDPIIKKLFTEERVSEAIEHVMKLVEKFNSENKNIRIPEMTMEDMEQQLLDDLEARRKSKSITGAEKGRKNADLRQLYESLIQKARLAEIEAKIPKKAPKGRETLWEIQKSALKGVKQTLGKMVGKFSVQEVTVIRDEFLGNFLDVYREMRKEREQKKKLNAAELQKFKKEIASQMEESLRDRYDEQSTKLIMDYFINIFNVEYLLDN